MHPAYSVILFTTMSGAGYGLLALLGLLGPAGVLPTGTGFAAAGFLLAGGLVTVGLLASTFHLGQPRRAWRAFSQWRSSWLSREAVLAALAYLPGTLFAGAWIGLGLRPAWLGALTAATALATVVSTGMIYGSLKTIPRWHHWLTTPVYLLLGLASGALLLSMLVAFQGPVPAWLPLLVLVLLLLGAGAKLAWWRAADGLGLPATAASATGLSGPISTLDPPHTQLNFVQREMGYAVGRRHARRLRQLAGLGAGLAGLLMLPLLAGWPALWAWALGALLVAWGALLVERWLFFAEAEHVVVLYYGGSTQEAGCRGGG
ncbi:MAG: dimethyl sulfoxide reductase anchor subunit [Chromatiales bacterium]|nr:dimethyl sulfoxide reductase anchor subunit [Chromatiales bacterium]